jgi:putative ABC transport system permease protein
MRMQPKGGMSRHYVSAALHRIRRSPAHAVVSLLGLAVAFASALLIGVYVRTELTHDQWVPGYENVFRLAQTVRFGGQILESNSGSPAEALWLKQDLPEVQSIARLLPRIQTLRHGEVEISSTVVWADPDIFRVLPFPIVSGDPSTALQDADAVVVSRALALRLLGSGQVIGTTIEVDGQPMRITAVLDRPPGPSHLFVDVLASGRSAHSGLAVEGGGRLDWGAVHTYLRTTPGAAQEMRRSFPDLIDRHVSAADIRGMPSDTRVSSVVSYSLQPLTGIHMLAQKDLVQPYTTNMIEPAGDMNIVLALAAIGLLILVVAAVNYVGILSAKAAQREVETGLRKVAGASRRELLWQFVGESTALAITGALVGILVGIFCLKGFGAFLSRDLTLSMLLDPVIAGGAVAAVLLVGVTGGLYPGLIQCSARPAQILKGREAKYGSVGALRHVSVIFQFTLLIALVISVLVVGRQVSFMLQGSLRVQADSLLYVHAPCTSAFTDRIAALPGTRGVACAAGSFLGLDGAPVVPASLPDGTPFRFHIVGVGPGALELLGLKPLAGRFPDSRSPDEEGVVINHAALRGLRLASPLAAIGQPMPGSVGTPPHIIGVVDDFPLQSLRERIGPVMFRTVRNPGLLLVRLQGSSIQRTVREIEDIWKSTGNAGPLKMQFHEQYVRRLYDDLARLQQLCTVFSVVAALLAALGVYGLSALALEQGAVGVGVRKAFGASRADILQLLLWKFSIPVLIASLLAWPLSWLLMQNWLEGFAYRIELPLWIFLMASSMAVVVTLATVIGHALQLSQVKPVVALRHR